MPLNDTSNALREFNVSMIAMLDEAFAYMEAINVRPALWLIGTVDRNKLAAELQLPSGMEMKTYRGVRLETPAVWNDGPLLCDKYGAMEYFDRRAAWSGKPPKEKA